MLDNGGLLGRIRNERMGAGNGSHFFYVCNWKIFQAIVCAIVMEVIANQWKLLEVVRPMEVIGNLGVIGELSVISGLLS